MAMLAVVIVAAAGGDAIEATYIVSENDRMLREIRTVFVNSGRQLGPPSLRGEWPFSRLARCWWR